jgi:hypothetical protein
MNHRTFQWIDYAAVVIAICFMTSGLPIDAAAQETQTLQIHKIKPVPELDKRRVERTARIGASGRDDQTDEVADETSSLDGIYPERNEVVIDDGTLPLSPDATYHIGDRAYRGLPSAFREGSRVTFWRDEETGMVKGLRLHENHK